MKKIYVVQVELPTFINKVVHIITGYKYNHFSISLDESLEELYSFQVRNMNTALVGGFLKEKEGFYLHGKENLELKEFVYEIPVSDSEYERIYEFIKEVERDKEYIFNYISALFMFSFGGIKGYKAFHCTEFVAEVLSLLDDIKLPRKSYLMRPKDLHSILVKYKCEEKIISSEKVDVSRRNLFYKKIKIFSAIKKILYCLRESICRVTLKRASKNFDYKKVNFYNYDVQK